MIAMVAHPQFMFDQVGNPLRGPQLRAVSLRDGSFGQKTNESFFLLRCQPWWPARRRLGLQCIPPTGLHRIAPAENTACVASHASGDLVKGELLLEEGNHPAPTFFQRLRRTVRSHRDTPFQDVSIVLHYLCGSQ